MTAMKNKVYGIVGISSIMSNFNADFTGYPRKIEDTYFASNVAGKYTCRDYWKKDPNLKVFYLESYKKDGDNLIPRNIKERYEALFGKELKANSAIEILKNLFTCVDVINFGAAFPEKNNNISLTGAVQFTEGINKFEMSEVIREQILSPFNPNEKDATTLGSRVILNEAHYFYGLSINPANYNEYINEIEGFEGYTKEAYELLKDGCLYGASGLQSMSKVGVENEFALFVECKENVKPNMANLHSYVDYIKEEGAIVGTIDITRLFKYLKDFIESIDSIEIYMNPYTCKLQNWEDEYEVVEDKLEKVLHIKNETNDVACKILNILNKEEIKNK